MNIRDSGGNTPLHGDLDESAARALIDLGANVNAQNKRGETPLMWTSSEAVAEILLNAGADVSRYDPAPGKPPWTVAAKDTVKD